MSSDDEDTPEWLAVLEAKKEHKLAHEYGEGAPCVACTICPGLLLHFWRKKCTICGCNLEDHMVDDDYFPQYQIMFGDGKIGKRIIFFQGKERSYDWAPPTEDSSMIEDYMSALPEEWRPETGTRGGLYRKRQLGRQLPRYDVDALAHLPLSEKEEKAFEKYHETMQTTAAGSGLVAKLEDVVHDGIYRATPIWFMDPPSSEVVDFNPLTAEVLRYDPKNKEEAARVKTEQLPQHACQRCNVILRGEEVVVKASQAKNAFWHPQCFLCSTCDELLTDLHYFQHADKLYCGRDYAKAVKIFRCHACDELIFEAEYACADGNYYHNRHFCCSVCDKSLGGRQFLQRKGDIICPSCYQKEFNKKCQTCKKEISAFDMRVEVGKFVFHQNNTCFSCPRCNSALEGRRLFIYDGHFLCSSSCQGLQES